VSVLGEQFAKLLRFENQERVTASVDRFTDVAPWNAADRMVNTNSPLGLCSSGFGVHNPNTGHHYLLTAAHCSSIAGQWDFFWNSDNFGVHSAAMGFSAAVAFGSYSFDSQLIDAPSSTITWTATSSRSQVTASYQPVLNDSNRMINEGATSIPWQSGLMTVTSVDGCVAVSGYHVWGTVPICHLWGSSPSAGNCAVKGGDSGGPVVSYSAYGPLAIGQIVAGNCTKVYFHSVRYIEFNNPYGSAGPVRVNTVFNP
jgi:hypothetical protein